MSLSEEMGILKAITWLRDMGRPILADKMERELLHLSRLLAEGLPIQNPSRSVNS